MVDIQAPSNFDMEMLAQVVAAVGALGAAAVGLVDAAKFMRGGVSNAGWKKFKAGLDAYDTAFQSSIGAGWDEFFRASWLNGAPKSDQLTSARNYIRLGLTPATAGTLATACGVNAASLTTVATKIQNAQALTPQEFELVGRMDASVEARLGAAYERAEQIYRSGARLAAGAVSIVLALLAWWLVLDLQPQYFGLSLLAGVVAVPVAPVVKDLISALSASAKAARSLKGLP